MQSIIVMPTFEETPLFPTFEIWTHNIASFPGRFLGRKIGQSTTLQNRGQFDMVTILNSASSIVYEITDYDEKKLSSTFNHGTRSFMFGTYEIWVNDRFVKSERIEKIRGFISGSSTGDYPVLFDKEDAALKLTFGNYEQPTELTKAIEDDLNRRFRVVHVALMYVLKPTVKLQLLGAATG